MIKGSGVADVRVTSEAEDAASEAERKKKKARTTFTGRQIFELEKQFEIKKYLSSSERAEMAKLLNVTETQVSEIQSWSFDLCRLFRFFNYSYQSN